MIILPSGNKVPISISNLKTQTKIDETGLLFPSENFIENDTIVIVNTCEQLLYALFCSIKI